MKQFSRTRLRVLVFRMLAMVTLLASSLTFGMTAATTASAAQTTLKPPVTVPSTAQNTIAKPDAKSKQPQAQATVTPNLAWTVSLSASSTSLWPTQYSTLTARTNQDVGPTPYWTSIYDQTAHTYVAICGYGTSCTASVTQPTATTHYYVAYVSSYPSGNPPTGIQATSSVVSVTWRSLSVSLAASPTTVNVGSSSTLTATTSVDVGPTPFYTEIYDVTTGTRLNVCGAGITCTASVLQSVVTTHKYLAYVSAYSTAFPPTGIQATSVASFVSWSNTYRVSLFASRTSYGHDTLTAYSNVNVGPTPYYIEIFNVGTGARVAVCGTGTSCSANVALSFGYNHFVAFVSSYSTTLPPAGAQASSSVIHDFFFPIIRQP